MALSPAVDATPAPAGYHSELAMERAIVAAVKRAGTRAHHRVIGTSVDGRPLHAITIAAPGRTPDADRPHGAIQAGMHGNEVIGTELGLRLLDLLAAEAPVPEALALLDLADVTVFPCCNPDARQRSLASLASPRPFRGTPRRNTNGVDLNRNWPFPEGVSEHWLPISGTSNPRLPWFRGTAPLSEPESRASFACLEERPADALLDLHSFGRILIYPWTSKIEPPADEAGFWQMIDALRARQGTWTYDAKQSRAWYPIVGSMDDYVYERFGTLMITVEIGKPLQQLVRRPGLASLQFWFTNPVDVGANLDNDALGCLDALIAGVTYRREHPAK